MTEPMKVSYAVPPGQPLALTLFYASELTVQASSNDVTIVLHDLLPVSGTTGIDPNLQVRRPLATIKVSPQTLKGMAKALSEAVRVYEEDYGLLNVVSAGFDHE